MRPDTLSVPELSAQQRYCHLMLLLFTPGKPVGLTTISRLNRVLPEVTQQDIRAVEQEIDYFHHLRIVHHPLTGYRLSGSAGAQRLCLLHWLKRALRLTPNAVETLFLPRLNAEAESTPYHTPAIDDILTQAEPELLRCFSDAERAVITHFLHYCRRQQRQEARLAPFSPRRQIWLRQKAEYPIARRLCDTVLPLSSNAEYDFITLMLRLLKTYRYPPAATDEDRQLLQQIDALIERVESETGCRFSQRETLRRKLFTHLGPAVERCLFGLRIDDSLLEEISRRYADLLTLTRTALRGLEQSYRLSIPQEELCLIAVTFGAWLAQEGALQENGV